MEADECIRDVIRSTETEYQSRRCVLHRLDSVDKVGREADQCAITICRVNTEPGQRRATGRKTVVETRWRMLRG